MKISQFQTHSGHKVNPRQCLQRLELYAVVQQVARRQKNGKFLAETILRSDMQIHPSRHFVRHGTPFSGKIRTDGNEKPFAPIVFNGRAALKGGRQQFPPVRRSHGIIVIFYTCMGFHPFGLPRQARPGREQTGRQSIGQIRAIPVHGKGRQAFHLAVA